MKMSVRVSQEGKTFEGEVLLREVEMVVAARRVSRAERGTTGNRHAKPSSAVDGLYHREFFAAAQALGDVIAQLGKDGYNFSAPSVLMALKSRDYLQRRGAKGSYRFVQKYPAPTD